MSNRLLIHANVAAGLLNLAMFIGLGHHWWSLASAVFSLLVVWWLVSLNNPMRTHRWNRLLWRKRVLSGPVGKFCPLCTGMTNGSVLYTSRISGRGTVYLLPCWCNISPTQGDVLLGLADR